MKLISRNKEIQRLVGNTSMLYVLKLSGQLFPLITLPYLTRTLGPNNYGIIIYCNAIISYFYLLIDYGFILSATRKCSINRENNAKLTEIVSSVLQAKILLSVLGFIVLLLVVYFVENFKEFQIYLLLSYIPVFISAFIADYLFRGIENMKIITYRTIISKAIYTVLILIFVRNENDYLLIPIITSIGEFVNILWVWLYIYNKLSIKIINVGFRMIFNEIKEGSIYFLSRIATTTYSSTNILVLGLIYNNNALLAQFGIANKIILFIRGLFSPISDSLYPYMTYRKNFKIIKIILLIVMPVILVGIIILYLFSEPIITIIAGPGYEKAVGLFRLMLPLVLITLPIYVFGFPVLGALNKNKEANYSVITASIFHMIVLVTMYFLHIITFKTVIMLTIITEFIILIYRLVIVGKEFKNNKKD